MLRPRLAFLIIIALFLGFSPFPALGKQNEALEQLYGQPLEAGRKDFVFTIEQTVDTQNSKIYIFKLERPDFSQDAKYTLRYFQEGHIESVLPEISLPYTFKRNYAGLKKAEFTVAFELRDAEARISVLTLNICVE